MINWGHLSKNRFNHHYHAAEYSTIVFTASQTGTHPPPLGVGMSRKWVLTPIFRPISDIVEELYVLIWWLTIDFWKARFVIPPQILT